MQFRGLSLKSRLYATLPIVAVFFFAAGCGTLPTSYTEHLLDDIAPNAADTAMDDDGVEVDTAVREERALRTEALDQANALYQEARRDFGNGHWQNAITGLINARIGLQSASTTLFEKESAKLDRLVDFTFTMWAHELVLKAEALLEKELYDKAIETYEAAADKDTRRERSLRRFIKHVHQIRHANDVRAAKMKAMDNL